MSKSPFYQTFGGKQYRFIKSTKDKQKAKEWGIKKRDKGYDVKIVNLSGVYEIYARKEKK